LCRSYDYSLYSQKLKLFPTTLKDVALRWFTGLTVNSISTWDGMKKLFLKKYQDYCKTRDIREEIFGMTQKEEESLEDFLERFQYYLQRSKMNQLNKETLRTILLRTIRPEFLEVLNLMGVVDVSKLSYDDVCELCQQYTRRNSKVGKGSRDTSSRFTKSVAGTGVTRAEMGNLFENFKTNILSILSS